MGLSNRPVGGNVGMPEVRKASNVRSVYLPILRGQVPEVLAVFDAADPNLIVGKRDVTTVPTQALFLMNNPFVLKQAEEMAKRVLAEKGLDQSGRINLAYRLALGRLPTEPRAIRPGEIPRQITARHSTPPTPKRKPSRRGLDQSLPVAV